MEPGLAPEKNSADGGELALPYELPDEPLEDIEFVLFLFTLWESNILIAPYKTCELVYNFAINQGYFIQNT